MKLMRKVTNNEFCTGKKIKGLLKGYFYYLCS